MSLSGNVDLLAARIGAEIKAVYTALAGKQASDSDLTAIAALAPTNDDVVQRKAGAWTNRSMAQLKTDLAVTASDVGAQPLDSDLTTIAALTATTNNMIQSVGSAWASRTPTQVKAALAIAESDVTNLVTDLAAKQPLDSDLTAIAALTATTDSFLQSKASAWTARTPTQVAADLVTPLSSSLQPIDSDLTAIAAIAPTNDDVIQRKAGAWTNRTMAQLKADLAVTASDVGAQPLDSDLTAIAALTATTDNVIQSVAGTWASRTPAQYKATLALAAGDVGLGNVDNTSNVTERAATRTLTNARITKRIGTTASSATPTADADAHDQYNVTALAAGATFGAPTGTPTDGQMLMYRIKDNGTARALAWNAVFRALGVTLPTTTVISKTLYVGTTYNAADSKWDVIATAQEA